MIAIASIRAAYRKTLDQFSTYTVTSVDGLTTASVRGRPMGEGFDEIAGAAGRDSIKVIMLAEDFDAYGVPQEGDVLTLGDRSHTIEYVDPDTRSVQGVPMAYVVRAVA